MIGGCIAAEKEALSSLRMVDWEVAGYAWDLLPKAVRDLVCRRHGFELENACSECAYKASLLEQGRYDGREHPAGDLLEGRTIGCRRRVGASGWLASTAAASSFPSPRSSRKLARSPSKAGSQALGAGRNRRWLKARIEFGGLG